MIKNISSLPIRKTLSKNLKEIMQEKVSTLEITNQKEFAEFLGISPAFLSEILNCEKNVSLDMLSDIASKVEKHPSKLIEPRSKKLNN